MDTKDVSILIYLDQLKSLSRTSKKLFMSQPAITYRLNRMEEEFGIKIANRYANGITFTESGKQLLDFAKEMELSYKKIRTSFETPPDKIEGKVRVDVATVFSKYYLAPMLRRFSSEYPKVDVIVNTVPSSELDSSLLTDGKSDIIIRRRDVPTPYQKMVLLEEPYGIITDQYVPIEQLSRLPRIKYKLPPQLDPDTIFWNWWQEHCNGTEIERTIKVDSIEAALDFVSNGLGWTMLPQIHLKRYSHLTFTPLTSSDKLFNLKTIMLYNEAYFTNNAIRSFAQFVRYYFKGEKSDK